MISNPRVGTPVVIRYKKALKHWFPLEGKSGVVAIPCKRRGRRQGPINHGVLVDGAIVVIPCGNLFPAVTEIVSQPTGDRQLSLF